MLTHTVKPRLPADRLLLARLESGRPYRRNRRINSFTLCWQRLFFRLVAADAHFPYLYPLQTVRSVHEVVEAVALRRRSLPRILRKPDTKSLRQALCEDQSHRELYWMSESIIGSIASKLRVFT